jgi:transposase
MGLRLQVEIKESQEELEKAVKYAQEASSLERLQMLYWLKSGQVTSRSEIAERLGRDEATITRWLRKYKDGGSRGLLEVKQAPGKQPIVSGENLERLKQRLEEPQGFPSYNQIQQWLESELGLSIAYKTVDQLVRYSLGAKLKVPRPQSRKQHPESQSHFKKKLPEAFKFLQDEFGAGQRLRYMCQDETRLGLKTIAGRLITAPGVKPVGLSQWQRDNFYLYGVVEPLTGYSFFYEFSHLDGDCFEKFLELLAASLGDDVAVVQFDQGSFHKIKTLDCPENIIPIFQPSHSPELNPIERFWEFLKSKLQWENCQTLTHLRQKLADVLESITPETIASLTSYDFILEALFSAPL